MTNDETYTFHIDAFTPSTIPMARLAEYMAALASLMGSKERVHFEQLESGSTRLKARVEREAAPKVRTQLTQVTSREDAEAAKAYKRLNELLRNDNASAQLLTDDSTVLQFPGNRAVRPAKMGPFNDAINKDGVLVRIGGTDNTAHAMLEDSGGQTWSFEVSRELARQLAPHLFGGALRLIGTARWVRTEEAVWEHTRLSATGFQLLVQESLADAVARIRSLDDMWDEGAGIAALLQELRKEDGGVH